MASSDLQSIIDDLSGLLARTPALTQDWAAVARWCEHKIDVLSARSGEPGLGPILAALEQAAVALHQAIGDHSSGHPGLAEVHRVGTWWIAETQATGIPQTGAPPAHWSPGGSGSTEGPSGTAGPAGPAVQPGPPAPQFRLSRVVTRPGGFSAPSGGYLTAEDLVTSFDPAKDANLPQVTHEDATKYLDAHRADRPWLDFTANPHPDLDHPDVLRALVAIDQGGGHALSRHEGFAASGDRLSLRVAALEDPAQTDPAKRRAGVDAFKAGRLSHVCQTRATAITDPIAFLTAYIHATKHPDVRAILDSGVVRGTRPWVVLPVLDLLGANGHRFCAGVQLESDNGDLKLARARRVRWIKSGRPAGDSTQPEPTTSRIPDFSGADVVIALGVGAKGKAEIRTLYVDL
ncbi:hypothetical protein [Microlunatus parietis]|uniref:Uncharacterized protein n=1 Tax=Microlunatus parietis TaxID=682979 RepID=A0A7Y9IED9_9ACTN|nr:hypothetical protein [Microlunatus parietis]NYE75245.1 hypothetical protein [Microlunatus parietis]